MLNLYRSNLAGTLSGNPNDVIVEKEGEEDGSEGVSIGSAGSLGQPRNNRWQPVWATCDTTSDGTKLNFKIFSMSESF